MAYDEGLAELMRDDLAALENITEQKMFGGICFMWRGNMLAGVHKGGAMYRVGKNNHATALAIEGAQPMAFTGRPMGGLVDIDEDAVGDDTKRAKWLRLAMEFVGNLPDK